jgi:phospholipid/cholesterol/gamma-HCH transport system permease protein
MKITDLFFGGLGQRILLLLERIGGISVLFAKAFINIFIPPFNFKRIFSQMLIMGVQSVPVVLLTAIFTGMVLALQTTYQLAKFGVQSYIGGIVGLSMVRELGPVLTALMLAGRVGAAIAAEIGTMSVTEQIDALETLATNPIRYLVVPRLAAGMVMLPLLTAMADFIGIFGGYIVAIVTYNIPSHSYISGVQSIIVPSDILIGLLKTIIFGGIIAVVSSYFGFNTKGGAEGVGKSTTVSVVTASITILLADTLLTALFK